MHYNLSNLWQSFLKSEMRIKLLTYVYGKWVKGWGCWGLNIVRILVEMRKTQRVSQMAK